MATSQYIEFSDTWLRVQYNEGASGPISYPFAIVTDNHKIQKTNTSGSTYDNKDISVSASKGDKLHEASSPTSQPMNNYADNSFANNQSISNNGRARFQIDTFNSNLYSDPLSHDSDTQSLIIPTRLNPRDNELLQSPCLRKSQGK